LRLLCRTFIAQELEVWGLDDAQRAKRIRKKYDFEVASEKAEAHRRKEGLFLDDTDDSQSVWSKEETDEDLNLEAGGPEAKRQMSAMSGRAQNGEDDNGDRAHEEREREERERESEEREREERARERNRRLSAHGRRRRRNNKGEMLQSG